MHPIVTITKSFKFEASHVLPHHEGGKGKCAKLHGHSYKVDVAIDGPIQGVGQIGHNEEGMVVDFGHLKRAWAEIEDRYDHCHLNETLAPLVPTAENIAYSILEELTRLMQGVPGRIDSVTVWETLTSSATVRNV